MNEAEFRRRVEVYVESGLFDAMNAREAARTLWERFAPVFTGLSQRARAYDSPAWVQRSIESKMVTPGSVRKRLVSVFALRKRLTTDEIVDQLAGVLWASYQSQNA